MADALATTILQIRSEVNQWQKTVTTAIDAATGYGLSSGQAGSLAGALQKVSTALAGISQAEGKALQTANDVRLTKAAKVSESQALVTGASDAFNAALDALQQIATSTRDQLGRATLPKKPSSLSDVVMVDTKHDLETLIGGPDKDLMNGINRAAKLYQAALEQGDDATAYILAGGPMQLWYQAHFGDASGFALRFAQVANQRSAGKSTSGAADLYALLANGGPGTLTAFAQGIRFVAQREVESVNAAINAAIYANG